MNIIFNYEKFVPFNFTHDMRFNHAYIDINYNSIDYYELICSVCDECVDNEYYHALNKLLTSDKFYDTFGDIEMYDIIHISNSSDLYISKSCYVLIKRE